MEIALPTDLLGTHIARAKYLGLVLDMDSKKPIFCSERGREDA
jgi:hypothetical protein